MQDVLRQPRETGSGSIETEDMQARNAPSDAVRVGLSADCADISERMRRLLRGAAGIELVELAESAQPPAVLLLECGAYSPPERLRLQRAARRMHPARVLWLVSDKPPVNEAIHTVLDAVKFGWCHGYITRDCPSEDLLRAIKAVAQHDLWLPRGMVARALADSQNLRSALGPPVMANRSGHSRSLLTARERQILQLVRTGLTNKEVGRHLGIEEDTVKKHLRNMYAKLGVRRRAQMLSTIVREARASA
jgi:DNA-binding NarL/FixJ family response regulator